MLSQRPLTISAGHMPDVSLGMFVFVSIIGVGIRLKLHNKIHWLLLGPETNNNFFKRSISLKVVVWIYILYILYTKNMYFCMSHIYFVYYIYILYMRERTARFACCNTRAVEVIRSNPNVQPSHQWGLSVKLYPTNRISVTVHPTNGISVMLSPTNGISVTLHPTDGISVTLHTEMCVLFIMDLLYMKHIKYRICCI